MRLKVGDKNSSKYLVIDLDTNKSIRYVQEADDEKGIFTVVVTDKEGKLILDKDGAIITRIKKGRIRLEKKKL